MNRYFMIGLDGATAVHIKAMAAEAERTPEDEIRVRLEWTVGEEKLDRGNPPDLDALVAIGAAALARYCDSLPGGRRRHVIHLFNHRQAAARAVISAVGLAKGEALEDQHAPAGPPAMRGGTRAEQANRSEAERCGGRAMGDWMDISSAPRDGTQIYVWVAPNWHGRGCLARTAWLHGHWCNEFLNGSAPSNFRPTHWMPLLPPPPAAEDGTDG